MTKIAIVIQGPSDYVHEVKNAWKDFKDDIIFSTWEGSEKEYTTDDIVIFNEMPSVIGYWNFNLQKISTYNGLLKAKSYGYTHAIKVRSDYLPTNAKEFIKILNPDKINVLLWDYTTYLWSSFPSLNGYFTDHLVFGPIDEMIELWDIKDNFCSSQIMLTWSYISKLKNKIEINYFLPDLNENNNLFYIKPMATSPYGFNEYKTIFSDRILRGRYESEWFKTTCSGRLNYMKSPEETKKYMNDKYLNFLRYYNPLPKITILDDNKNDINFEEIIYPKNKLEIVSDKNNISGEYVISANKIYSNAAIMIEYLKKINTIYDGTNQKYDYHSNNTITWANPGNFRESGYKKGTECISHSDILLTKDEFFWYPQKNGVVDIDFLEIGFDSLLENFDNNAIGIIVDPIKCYLDELPNKRNILKVNKVITGNKIINTKVKILNSYIDMINIGDFLIEKNIRKIQYLQINIREYNIPSGIYNYISNLPVVYHPKKINFQNENDDILDLYYKIGYILVQHNDTSITIEKK
jgi:hypothetical protein